MMCPFCQTEYPDSRDNAGKTVKCGGCGAYFKLPSIPKCPVCSAEMNPGQRLCTSCGYDRESGEWLRTKKSAELEREDAEASKPAVLKAVSAVAEAFPGLFRPAVLLVSVVCFLTFLLSLLGCALLLQLEVYVTSVVILGAGCSVFLHGSAFLCFGEFAPLPTVLGHLRGNAAAGFRFLMFQPVLLIFLCAGWYLFFK